MANQHINEATSVEDGFQSKPSPCYVIEVKNPPGDEKYRYQESIEEEKGVFHRDGLDSDSIESLIPDGGYGWIVVFASFMCNFTVDGICYTFGLFLPYFLQEFGSSRGVTALAGSLLSGCYMTVGVFVSGLVNRFGCRPVAITGSLLAAVSFLISTQVTNINLLIVTYGIITGCSFGLIYLPSIVSVGYYFNRKRAFATAIAVCGSGFGAFVFSPLVEISLSTYGWKVTLAILAGCVSICSTYAILMKPLIPASEQAKPRLKDEPKNAETKSLTEIFDFSILKIPAMALLSVSNIFGMMGYYIPYVYIKSFSISKITRDDRLITETEAALLLSLIGLSNVIGRVMFGQICDKLNNVRIYGTRIRVTALLINNVCLIIAGVSVIIIPFCIQFERLMALCCLFGLTIAPYMSLTSIILVDLLSLERLSTTFGLISCFRGISSIIGPPLAGIIYELTDSYTEVFVAAGMLIIISACISVVVHKFEKCP